ncbi:hypothetical protein O3Q51_08250 [Cryomorphaceae bacterium 1068]|nr:hypothetical protein [Cryomorphaceae bacterium 1068]
MRESEGLGRYSKDKKKIQKKKTTKWGNDGLHTTKEDHHTTEDRHQVGQ